MSASPASSRYAATVSVTDGARPASMRRQVRHVERSRLAVEQADAHEHERRAHHAHRRVAERAVDLGAPPVERHQPERGDEHQLEPDVQVEDVAR